MKSQEIGEQNLTSNKSISFFSKSVFAELLIMKKRISQVLFRIRFLSKKNLLCYLLQKLISFLLFTNNLLSLFIKVMKERILQITWRYFA